METLQELLVQLNCQKGHFGLRHGDWDIVMSIKASAQDHMLTDVFCLHFWKPAY